MLIAASLSASCSCEDHPILFIAWVSTLLSSGLGYVGLQAYLGLRTVEPQRSAATASYWPRAPRPISEYKPLQSEHWGRSSDSSAHTSQTTLVQQ